MHNHPVLNHPNLYTRKEVLDSIMGREWYSKVTMAIRLDSVNDIPQEVLEALQDWNEFIKDHDYLDNLLEEGELKLIARQLNDLALAEEVWGIHYTRAIRTEIETKGLLVSSGEDRRAIFLEQYGHLFTVQQIVRIRELWRQYFKDPMQRRARDNRIWFNFTLSAFNTPGAEPLLSNFGGEQINMPLARDPEIRPILRTIGEPIIVMCRLDPNRVTTFSEYPWGKIWLSSYHLSLNPNALRFDQDGYQIHPLPPDKVVLVIPGDVEA